MKQNTVHVLVTDCNMEQTIPILFHLEVQRSADNAYVYRDMSPWIFTVKYIVCRSLGTDIRVAMLSLGV